MRFLPAKLLFPAVVLTLARPVPAAAEITTLPTGAFSFEHTLTLPGAPEEIYDALTGDLTGWWDHTFSGKPARFYLDPKPGGGFYEIFDESGDGVLHATVIYAQRGRLLRFRGPLGLSGKALDLVMTYALEPAGADSTTLTLTVNGAGQIDAGVPEITEQVWHHFLDERFKPYVESGKHRD
jgi:uncharacterized protein YndB with AHSA1/START domain